MMTTNNETVHRRPSHLASRGFTLIELLVTIGIIAVLVALLLPALAKVQNTARSASTQSTMTSLMNSCDSFQVDQKRVPGHFSQSEMGNSANGDFTNSNFIGLTNMENALIDLAGGIIPEDDPTYAIMPNSMNAIRDVAPFPTPADGALRIDTTRVGSGQFGGGYFTLSDGSLTPVEGQFGVNTGEGELTSTLMPDLLDSWGQPIMLCIRDDSARGVPPADDTDTDYFVKEISDGATLTSGRSLFYWGANAGYLRSSELGEDKRNQETYSIIGGEAGRDDAYEVMRAMQAVLGSPAFPVEWQGSEEQWRPARARGSVIAVSAGPDQIYFKKGVPSAGSVDDVRNKLFYAPNHTSVAVEVGGGQFRDVRSIDDFDDLISSTGG